MEALKIIGARKTAEVFIKAMSFFPGNKVPKDDDKRWEVHEKIREAADEEWDRLGKEFYKYCYDEKLSELLLKYVKENIEKFR